MTRILWTLLFIGCGGTAAEVVPATSSDTAPGTAPDTPATVPPTTPEDPDASEEPEEPEEPVFMGRCGDPVPAGASSPPPMPAYTGGTCPSLTPGYNTLMSSGIEREFLLVMPDDYDPAEALPIIVIWHHLGGDADSILQHGEIQESANQYRFIAAVPEKTGDLSIGFGDFEFDPAWPYLNVNSALLADDEATFFDDMVTCIEETYDIDDHCVASAGISAGALWVSQLMQLRSERLSSALILSGGIGPATGVGFFDVKRWSPPARAIPTLIGWGGPFDWLGVDFQTASLNLEDELVAGGHFVEECVHNCGHGVPPVDPSAGLGLLYGFALDHPYWQTAGTSIYEVDGLPTGTPDWCAIGVGNATMRTGECPIPDLF